jgi:hypothetical protein
LLHCWQRLFGGVAVRSSFDEFQFGYVMYKHTRCSITASKAPMS